MLLIHSSCWPCALRTLPAPPEKIALQNKNWSKYFCKQKIKTIFAKVLPENNCHWPHIKIKTQTTALCSPASQASCIYQPRQGISAHPHNFCKQDQSNSSKTLHYLLSHYLLSHLPSSLIKVLASSSHSLPFHLVRPGSRMLYTAMYSRHSSTFKLNQIYRVSHK